jgi:hypothetical protein
VYGLGAGISAIAAGRYHTCALTAGGGALCWGYNSYGQLGNGTTATETRPVAVSGLASGVAALTLSQGRTCARTTGGAAQCWGDNYWGGIGDGTTTNRSLPTAVLGLESGVAWLATGDSHTCAVTTGGAALCWGGNHAGQLGTGARAVGQTPLAAYGFGGAIAAAAITPDHGSGAGGTVVTITGAYFLQGATVTIGGVAATQVSVISTTALMAVTGPHAPGAGTVVVTNPDATQATTTGGFTYEGGGATPTFTDNPLVARTTSVKAVHITELRGYVNDLRTRHGLSAFAWTNAALSQGVSPIRAVDVAELRTALAEAYAAASRTAPTYTDPTLTPGVTVVTATHIAELRAAVLALW